MNTSILTNSFLIISHFQVAFHPDVKNYVTDLVQSLRPLVTSDQLQRLDFVITDRGGHPLERLVFGLVSRKSEKKELERCLYPDLKTNL